MSTLDDLLNAVKNKISQHTGDNKETGGLLDKITDLFGEHKRAATNRGGRDVRPASEDPYGDPADEVRGRSVKPASEDPYGDPADERRR